VDILHHPALQSLVAPLVLALAGMGLLRAVPGPAGPRWAPFGAVLGFLAALALWPGFDWPATARAQKLPWIVLAGSALAALAALSMASRAGGVRASPLAAWLAAVLGWAGASSWLADAGVPSLQTAATVLAGTLVLALLAWGERLAPARLRSAAGGRPQAPSTATAEGAAAAAALTVAALGLAALAGSGGSLLLAQLALMLGTVSAVAGLWLWWRPGSGPAGRSSGGYRSTQHDDTPVTVATAALMPLGLAWLSIAQALPAQAPAGSARLALLTLAFAVPPLLSRSAWGVQHPRRAPIAVAVLAAVPVALALAWQLGAGGSAADAPGTVGDDDPYYTPQWR